MLWFTSLSCHAQTVSLFVIAFHCTCCPRLAVAESYDYDQKPLMGQGTGCGMGADGYRHCGILPKIGDCLVYDYEEIRTKHSFTSENVYFSDT